MPHGRWRLTLTLVAVAVLGGVELTLIRGHLETAWDVLGGADPVWIVAAVACTMLSMHVFARVQRRMVHAAIPAGAPRVPIGRMVALTYAANAVNTTVPAGSAVSVGYILRRLRAWGVPPAAAGFAVLASGALSTVTFTVLLLACALTAGGLGTEWLVGGLALVVAGVALLAVRGRAPDARSVLRRLLELLARPLERRWPAAALAVRRTADGLDTVRPRRRDWIAGGSFALVNWMADLACLVAVFHAVHGMAGTSLPLVLGAYVAGMSASSVAFLPGGLGVVEVAMIVTLHAGGAATASATAAVVLYRMISCVLVVVIGWLVFVVSAVAGRAAVAVVEIESPHPAQSTRHVTSCRSVRRRRRRRVGQALQEEPDPRGRRHQLPRPRG